MSQQSQNTKQNSERFSMHSAQVEVKRPAVNLTYTTTASEEIRTMILQANPTHGHSQHILAASGLSAGVASQLISSINTTSPITGGVAHTFLSVACIMGLATLIIHASFPVCASSIKTSKFLGYLSLWFATIGVVVLAWAIQPESVAIVVTVVFAVVLLAMVASLVYLFARIPLAEQKVVRELFIH
ncbi:hypothetical protein BD410DRAFT_832308 [Rickenella mellea]|uniref:Uncharacterized protein n=1 Tax=Rickenella mellea TaxID=50990 RepID=A0A4Y7PLM3_9AGAM|nr:hypothetical protein BD410DRAFT_832308 [Rickenella mellea]